MNDRAVLDGPDITRALTRITHEILERNRGSADLLLLGGGDGLGFGRRSNGETGGERQRGTNHGGAD